MASFFLAYLWIYCFTKISFYHSVSCALLFFIPPYTVLRSRLQLLRIVSFGYFRARCTKDSFGIILFEKRERYIASDSTFSGALSTHILIKNCFAGAQEAFKLVVEAHSVLSDPAKRTKHDFKRKNGSSTTFWTKCPHCECQFQYIKKVLNHRLVCQTCNKIFTAYRIEDQEPMPAKQTDHYLVVGMGLWVPQFLLISAYFRHPDYRGNNVEHLNKFLS